MITELDEEIRNKIKEKRILIIEDDEGLSSRLENAFKYYEAEIAIRHYSDSGFEELTRAGLNYHLIVVDVMLPRTKEDYEQIKTYRVEDNKCLDILMHGGIAEADDATRIKREYILTQINALIDKCAGINMIKNWINKFDNEQKIKRPGILFLTVLGIDRGEDMVGMESVKWVEKPVSIPNLMNNAMAILK